MVTLLFFLVAVGRAFEEQRFRNGVPIYYLCCRGQNWKPRIHSLAITWLRKLSRAPIWLTIIGGLVITTISRKTKTVYTSILNKNVLILRGRMAPGSWLGSAVVNGVWGVFFAGVLRVCIRLVRLWLATRWISRMTYRVRRCLITTPLGQFSKPD